MKYEDHDEIGLNIAAKLRKPPAPEEEKIVDDFFREVGLTAEQETELYIEFVDHHRPSERRYWPALREHVRIIRDNEIELSETMLSVLRLRATGPEIWMACVCRAILKRIVGTYVLANDADDVELFHHYRTVFMRIGRDRVVGWYPDTKWFIPLLIGSVMRRNERAVEDEDDNE